MVRPLLAALSVHGLRFILTCSTRIVSVACTGTDISISPPAPPSESLKKGVWGKYILVCTYLQGVLAIFHIAAPHSRYELGCALIGRLSKRALIELILGGESWRGSEGQIIMSTALPFEIFIRKGGGGGCTYLGSVRLISEIKYG